MVKGNAGVLAPCLKCITSIGIQDPPYSQTKVLKVALISPALAWPSRAHSLLRQNH